MLYNWAAENLEKVKCIAGIYPVCNLISYPGLNRAAPAYKMTESELEKNLRLHNPIDKLKPLAEARIPIFHIHGQKTPQSKMEVSFTMLLNLASVAAASDKEHLWGFVQRYAPDTSPSTHPDLDQATEFAIRYYNDFVKPKKKYRMPTDLERQGFEELKMRLSEWNGGLDPEALQGEVYSCGRDRFDPLRDWFSAIYEVLLGASQGPRLLLWSPERRLSGAEAWPWLRALASGRPHMCGRPFLPLPTARCAS